MPFRQRAALLARRSACAGQRQGQRHGGRPTRPGRSSSIVAEACMADITLAEFNGRVFLVGGEAYLDDLLANTLAKEVSIELVQCERQSAVHELWVQHCGEPQSEGLP